MKTKSEKRKKKIQEFIVHRSSFIVALLASGFWLLTPAALRAATHVTATYDLGANPQVMTTVSGQPQYGLVFAQRNKSVTYNSVEYTSSVVKGYLNASGQLNDGAGNLWLDLIPNLGATPADSYYVVTVNIQGRVHAEIWVLPDVGTVAAETVRQTQPPSATSGGFDLSIATGLLALTHGGTGQSIWIANRCVRVNSAGTSLESAASDCGTGGGSAPVASATVSGTVKTDTTVGDPVVYLTTTADTLLAGKANTTHAHSESDVTNLVTDLAAKAALTHSHAESDVTNLVTDLAAKVPTARSVSTNSPLAGGGTLGADLTLSCPTCEVTGNKNAASGYAGLTASTKLNAAQGQEVWSATDLTDYSSTSGTGSAAIRATITTPSSNDVLAWNGANWVNQAPSGGSNHNFLSATHSDTVAASPVLGDIVYANGTPAWTKLAGNATSTKKFMTQTGTGTISAGPGWDTIAAGDLPSHNHAAGDVTSGTFGFARGGTNQTSWTASRCVRVNDAGTALESASGDCGTGGGGGDNVSVNGTAASDADFDDATPAAEAGYINVKWQKDAGAPNNISAEIPLATASLAGAVSTAAQTFAGAKTFSADMGVSTDGSSEATPRVAAFTNLSSGEAGRFQFGDEANAFQSGFSRKLQVYSYWGLKLQGSRESPSAPAFEVGDAADPSVEVAGATASKIVLRVTAPSSPSGDLTEWLEGATEVAAMRPGGILDVDTGFRVNGAATTDRCLLGNGTNFVGSGSDCLTTDNSKTLTNKTLDAEGTGNNLTTSSKVYMIAAGCDNATAAAAWDLPTSSAAGKACLGTGPRLGVLTFADAATSGAYTNFRLPSDWTGNVDLVLLYTGDTNSTNNIVWQPAESCVADGEDLLAASFTTTTSATGAGPTTAGQRKSLTFSNMTMTGCAAGETMFLRIQRLGADGSDAYTGVAQLMAVEMTLRRQQ